MSNKDFEIIIIAYNNFELTKQCIQSIINTTEDFPVKITVIDNASTDNTVSEIKNIFPFVNVIENKNNFGYAGAINKAVKLSNTKYFIISNNDVIFHQKSIERIFNYLIINPNTAVVGPQQVFPNNKWEYSYGEIPSIKSGIKDLFLITFVGHFFKKLFWNYITIDYSPKTVGYVDGAIMGINRKCFDEVKGFDEDYFFFSEEMDFCFRCTKLGFQVVFHPDITATHYRGASYNNNVNYNKIKLLVDSKLLFCSKHLSKNETAIYAYSEYLNSKISKKIISLALKLVNSKNKEAIEKKYNTFIQLSKCWKEYFRKNKSHKNRKTK